MKENMQNYAQAVQYSKNNCPSNFSSDNNEDSMTLRSSSATTSSQTSTSPQNYIGRILLFSYAFPPLQVQMTAAVYKTMAAIACAGFSVDVICSDAHWSGLPLDDSLLPYAEKAFGSITRLHPSNSLIGRLRNSSRIFSRVPDLMTVLHESAYSTLMDMDLTKYDAVMTWSPFHSINSVMVKVKKAHRNVPWIAQFCDPWAGNPLEVHRLNKLWNELNEPITVNTTDYIVHSSRYSLDLMLENHPTKIRSKTSVIPHAFDDTLFPQRPKAQNDKILLRYVGVLYGRRSPEPLFQALVNLFTKRPDLRNRLHIEFVGLTPSEMLQTPAALSLPEGTISSVGNVSFVDSLAKMYDADILVMVEADIRQNLFLPSKLSDYMGARTPMVGLVPAGSSEDAFKLLKGWHARPNDIEGIARAIEDAIEHVTNRSDNYWCDESYRNTFSGTQIAKQFTEIMAKL
jgi:glycosyltransferase involved in cell wall biosynthesis